jgi:Outer membrane protein beta-barrel domain
MLYARSMLASLAVAALLASPLAAQNQAVYVFAKAGGVNALTSLTGANGADLKATGYTLAAGAGWQVQRYITIRGDFTYAQSPLHRNSMETGQDVNRFFYDAAVQLQYLTSSGFEPYVFAGGGAVTIHQVGTSGGDVTKGTFTYGLGLNYAVPRTGLQLFVEGKSWVYDASSLNGALAAANQWQDELAWSGGVAYRFPL